MKQYLMGYFIAFVMAFIAGCTPGEDNTATQPPVQETNAQPALKDYPVSVLPEGLVWETNNEDPPFASPDAVKGGRLNTYLTSFPLTFRVVGPDAGNQYRSIILENQMALTSIHPITGNLIPGLATHWTYSGDMQTVYYKLNPAAEWSDGKPVTADDFMFALEFMRSEYIVDPWYNNNYTKEVLEVRKYDDHTISITGATPKPKIDLHYYYGIPAIPRHFHVLDEKWVTDFNWLIEPNTGPYIISDVDKGKSLTLKRKKDWWANDQRYMQNRYNVDEVRFTVIRDDETAFQHFLLGELDTYSLAVPSYWHDKATGEAFDKGYINKIWFYNDIPRSPFGFYLNQDKEIFKDIRVRYGLSHALNIDGMIKTLMRGDYQRLHTFHTGYGDYSNTEIRARSFDLAAAEKYFNEAGWQHRGDDGILVKDGMRLSIRITYGSQLHTDNLVYLKEEAKKAGVELVLETMDPATFFRKISEKTYDVMFMGFGVGMRPAYWEHQHSENAHKTETNNITNTDNPEIDAAVMKFQESVDETERKELAKQLDQLIHDQGAFIPAYLAPYVREAFWRWVKIPDSYGTKLSESLFWPFGESGGLFWIDQKVKDETLNARKQGDGFDPVTIIDETYKIN